MRTIGYSAASKPYRRQSPGEVRRTDRIKKQISGKEKKILFGEQKRDTKEKSQNRFGRGGSGGRGGAVDY